MGIDSIIATATKPWPTRQAVKYYLENCSEHYALGIWNPDFTPSNNPVVSKGHVTSFTVQGKSGENLPNIPVAIDVIGANPGAMMATTDTTESIHFPEKQAELL